MPKPLINLLVSNVNCMLLIAILMNMLINWALRCQLKEEVYYLLGKTID